MSRNILFFLQLYYYKEWERLGIEDLVEMNVIRCSKALYDEVWKRGGDIAYAYTTAISTCL